MSWGYATEKWPALALTTVPTAPAPVETNLSSGARIGTGVTTSSSANTKGAYVEMFSSVASDVYGIWIVGSDIFVTNTLANYLLDIAVGASSSESVVIPNIDFGGAPPLGSNPGKIFYFPGIFIPSGSRIAVAGQSNLTSKSGTFSMFLDHGLQHNVLETTVITYGADTGGSSGTSVTPGTGGAFGTWTEIATSSRAHQIWCLGIDFLADASQTGADDRLIQLGYGPDADNITIIGIFSNHTTSNDEAMSSIVPPVCYSPVAISTKLWVRIAGSTAEARGIIIYGT